MTWVPQTKKDLNEYIGLFFQDLNSQACFCIIIIIFVFTKSFSFCVGFCYQNSILMNMNCKHITLLVLLDLSSAFDTVYHQILLVRLKSSIGINGTALNWFTSYLNNGSQRISPNGFTSDSFRLPYGVPQGSCLGPLLFTIYSSKLFEVIKYHLSEAHAYAYDTQLYPSFSPERPHQSDQQPSAMERCISDIRTLCLRISSN